MDTMTHDKPNLSPKIVLIIDAVFCGISGSYKAIFGLKFGLSCVIVSLEKYFLIHI